MGYLPGSLHQALNGSTIVIRLRAAADKAPRQGRQVVANVPRTLLILGCYHSACTLRMRT